MKSDIAVSIDDREGLTDSELRRMVRLLAEVAIHEGNLGSRKELLMDALADLIHADKWVWGILPPAGAGEKAVSSALLHRGFSKEEFAEYLKVIEHPEMAEMNAPFLAAITENQGKHTTRTGTQLDPSGSFAEKKVFGMWVQAGLGSVILSARVIDEGCLSFIGIYREHGGKAFTLRESLMAHVILTEVYWLHAIESPNRPVRREKDLTPRQRMTLSLLLEGLGRKQVADCLAISEHTVSGYIKELYRFYRVNSQAELMKHFTYGNGNHR